MAGSPVVIRYADDLVALCHSRQEALEVKARLAELAGAQGPGLQRGQDARRHPRGGLRLPGIQRPPLRRQAADQAEQGGHQTDPGTAAHRAAVPARDQRSGGDQEAQPDHPGLGRLLPDSRYPARCSTRWITTCGGSHTSGPGTATRTSRSRWVVDRYFGRFNKSRQDRWVFGDRKSGAYMHKFAWTRIVRHQIVRARSVPGRPRACRVLGRAAAQDAPADRQDQPWLLKAQDGRCPICGTRSCPPMTGRKPHASGNSGWRPPARRSPRSPSGDGTPDDA